MSRVSPFSPTRAPSRILVVRLGAIGDVVRTLPAVGLLRRTWPGARIGWSVETAAAPFVGPHPDVDEALVLPRGEIARAARRARPRAALLAGRYRRAVRAFGPDLSIDFQGSFKSGLVAWSSGAPVRVAFDRPHDRELSRLFANVRSGLPADRRHRVERAAWLAIAAGAAEAPLRSDLGLTPAELEAGRALAARLAAGARPVVSLAPFTSRRQSWKRYPAEGWARVARDLARDGAGVVLVGGPGEREEAEALREAAGPGVVFCGQLGLREMAALIAATDAFVGGDTGPMHMAWSAGTPVVAVYGPTDPRLNAPWGEGHLVLQPERVTGRKDGDRFPGITPERIRDAARRLLADAQERSTR